MRSPVPASRTKPPGDRKGRPYRALCKFAAAKNLSVTAVPAVPPPLSGEALPRRVIAAAKKDLSS